MEPIEYFLSILFNIVILLYNSAGDYISDLNTKQYDFYKSFSI